MNKTELERDFYREAFAILANDRGLTVDEALRMLLEQKVITNDGDRWDAPKLRSIAQALGDRGGGAMDEPTKARVSVIREYLMQRPDTEGRWLALQMCDRLAGIPGVIDAATDSEVSAHDLHAPTSPPLLVRRHWGKSVG